MSRNRLKLLLYLLAVATSVLLAVGFQESSFGTWIEQRAYDLRFKVRGPIGLIPYPKIVILAVDEKSFSEIPEPLLLWQGHFGRVIEALVQAAPAAVGIDFLFGDVSSLDPQGQQALLQALLRSSQARVPVFLAYRVGGQGTEEPPPLLAMAAGEDGFAYINLTSDSDDFVRRQQLYTLDEKGKVAPGLAYALASAASPSRRPADRPLLEPTLLINFRGLEPFPRLSFADALNAAYEGNTDFFKENFRDRIVLIGTITDDDLHSTPLYYWQERTRQRYSVRTPGVEIHAHTIATILEKDFIYRVDEAAVVLITAGVVVAVALLCFLLSPPAVAALVLGLLAIYLYLAVAYFFAQGWWLPVVAPLAGAFLAASVGQGVNYLLEGRERRRLRSLFKRYVSDQVIRDILERPEHLALAGERKEITVLFSDIRNYTTRSEGMAAEMLVRDLNEYLSSMVEVIQRNRGMVDKFMGDGIMAIFGAPLADSESSRNAVRAAREMIARLEELNGNLRARGAAPIRIGIGIHSGEAVVGNIGSPDKMEYTAIGDVVNTASRIEGLTKKYNCEILISGETRRLLDQSIPVEELGQETVKGKTQPVTLYRVSSPRHRSVDSRDSLA